MQALELFKQITQVPRPSKHEQKIRDFLIGVATSYGYAHRVDAIGNVLIQVPGAGSSANHPTVVLQGHMDMVCEKEPDVEINFLEDPLSIYEEGGYIRAKGTTLGADNGVGVSLAFYCASLPNHPPLEILLTVDEEVSMSGADGMQAGFFTGKRVVNLDSGQFGVITIGSAGGDDGAIMLPIALDEGYQAKANIVVEVQGLKGGHSGGNIGLNRLSAAKVMANLFEQYEQLGFTYRISFIDIGAAANAIARDAKVVLQFADAQQAQQAMLVKCTLESGDNEQLELHYTLNEVHGVDKALTQKVQNELLFLLKQLPHGVQDWQDEASRLPRTSANLASVKWLETAEDGMAYIRLVESYRSFDNAMLPAMQQRIQALVAKTSATLVMGGSYPAWPPKANSVLQDACVKVYQQLYGQKPTVVARHVGLECGYWERLSPGVEVISIGPNLFDLHSPAERVEIASVMKMQELLEALMIEL